MHEIEISGASIRDHVFDYPNYYFCNWLVYGSVVGTTDQYKECDSGSIPVFACEKLYPMVSLSALLTFDILLTKFPLGLILTLLLTLWPVGMILIVCRRKNESSKQKRGAF